MSAPQLALAGEESADRLLARDPFALLVGMLLDQQVPMEKAFRGPWVIGQRLGVERLDPAAVAAVPEEDFVALVSRPPAVHRFPAAMARRVQELARQIVERFGGNAAAVWDDAVDGADLVRRLRGLPGFGEQKARIFAALLGKQFRVTPAGWEQATAPFGEPGVFRSVADVVDGDSLQRVRDAKRAAKLAAASEQS